MRNVLLVLLMCMSLPMTAQEYEILWMNTKTIRIGGKDLVTGDVFSAKDKIRWASDKQAMKVLSLSDYKEYVLTSPDYKQEKVNNTKDFFNRLKQMSTRGSGSLSSVASTMNRTIYVADTTMISIDYVPDKSEFFYVIDDGGRHALGYRNGQLVLYPEIWAGKEVVEPGLFFHYADGGEERVSEHIRIVALPRAITKKKHK